MLKMYRILLLLLILSLVACGQSLDEELAETIRFNQIGAMKIEDLAQQFTTIQSKEAQLGKLLFFSKILSGKKDVACASCHHPFLGGDDDLSLSVGVEPVEVEAVGAHRKNVLGKIRVPRNAPTTFNSSLWKKRLFHDGRVERLNAFSDLPAQISTPDEAFGDVDPRATSLVQAQAGFPVTSEHEMRADYHETSSNDRVRYALLENVLASARQDKAIDGGSGKSWEDLFREIYSEKDLTELITFERIQYLLGEYEKSQVFIETPWADYLSGSLDAISDSAKRGAQLFYNRVEAGGAQCVSCHKGPFFTDESFHVMAFPQIGEGKDINDDDTGRFLRTGVPDDRYAFRTPSLINAEVTAPYGHSGSFQTLEEVIRHHGDPQASIEKYDFSLKELKQTGIPNEKSKQHTLKALAQLEKHLSSGKSGLVVRPLDDSEVDDLVAFIRALTDPCVLNIECLAPWVPISTDPNPDGLILYSSLEE